MSQDGPGPVIHALARLPQHQHWNSGCTNISQLHREITALSYRGNCTTIFVDLRLPSQLG